MNPSFDELFTMPARIRVYVAAPWTHKAEVLAAEAQLEAAGMEVTSRWAKYHPEVEEVPCEGCHGHGQVDSTTCPQCQGHRIQDYTAYVAMLKEQAAQDLEGIDQAHVLVLLNLGRSDGKAFELGYAYANMKGLVVVGGTEGNLFYHLPAVEHVVDVPAAIVRIQGAFEETAKLMASMKQELEKLQVGDLQQEIAEGKVTLN